MRVRFSEQARGAILSAQVEAQARGSGDVSTEHLLLGVLLQPESGGAVILREAGAPLEAVRALLPPLASEPDTTLARLDAHAKRALELTGDEARRFSSSSITTGHMAIALARADRGGATPILQSFGITHQTLRARFDSLPQPLQTEGQPVLIEASRPQQTEPQTPAKRLIARMARWAGRG